MKVQIHNHIIQISNPSEQIRETLSRHLYYEDKSKKYQLKKMSKNPFLRKSKQYQDLLKESSGTLLIEKDDVLYIPSGFSDLVISIASGDTISDLRGETGSSISLPWVDNIFAKKILRQYQQEAVDVMSDKWRGVMNFATGLGKTLTAIHLIRKLKKRTLVVCPNKSVAFQFRDELIKAFGSHRIGFVGDGVEKINDITVAIAMSANNKIEVLKRTDWGVVIFDETHHIAANTFYNVVTGLGKVGRIYGLTATSFRSDGKDVFIQSGCGDILVDRDVKWGIDNNFLAKPYFLIRNIETSGTDHSDKLLAYKTHVLKCKDTTDRISKDAQSMMSAGKSVLILVDSLEHGEMLSKSLQLPFAQGSDDASEEYVKQLNSGKIKGLIGTDGKIGEGTDTRNVDCLIIASFPGSKGLVLQSIGRGLRKQDSKENCIILDYNLTSSSILSRHCNNRIEWYREITDSVRIVD